MLRVGREQLYKLQCPKGDCKCRRFPEKERLLRGREGKVSIGHFLDKTLCRPFTAVTCLVCRTHHTPGLPASSFRKAFHLRWSCAFSSSNCPPHHIACPHSLGCSLPSWVPMSCSLVGTQQELHKCSINFTSLFLSFLAIQFLTLSASPPADGQA